MEKTWKPTVAGILAIIAGVALVIIGIVMLLELVSLAFWILGWDGCRCSLRPLH